MYTMSTEVVRTVNHSKKYFKEVKWGVKIIALKHIIVLPGWPTTQPISSHAFVIIFLSRYSREAQSYRHGLFLT